MHDLRLNLSFAVQSYVKTFLLSSVKTKVDFRPPAGPDLRPEQNARPLAGDGPLVSPY